MSIKSKSHYNHVAKLLVAILILGGTLLLAPNPAPAVHAEEDFTFILDISGPIYVQPGGNITYELKIENKSSQAYTNVQIYNDLPTHVTYISGGELINDTPKWVKFTLPNLAANSTQKVTWVAQADNGLAVGTIISNSSFNLVETPAGVTVGTGGAATTLIEAPGTLVAVYKDTAGTPFNVAVDGYQFENFTNEAPRNFSNDLGADDLFKLFGSAACKSGNTAATCVLSAAAQTWIDKEIKGMGGGHCEGMAATSLRLFNWEPFKTYSSPESFQTGANTAIDLQFPKDSLENYIAYYFVTQSVSNYYDATNEIAKSPVELIDILKRDFNLATPIAYTVGIYTSEWKAGHAIAAYGVEEVSPTESRILVYDNNFPKQRQYITVDTAANTWRYVTSATPGTGSTVYDGTATSGNLSLHLNSSRDLPAGQYFSCPFCNDAAASSASPQTLHGSVQTAAADMEAGIIEFQYTGEGGFLVVNDEGQKTGADYETDTFVDEIPDTEVIHFKGGLGQAIPPRIVIPFVEQDETFYSVFVHGANVESPASGSLSMHGQGFSLGVNDIELDPQELFEFTISPDGDHISFFATEDITAPEILIAHDPIHLGDPSVIFDIEGIALLAGEKVMLDLDPALERMHFNHTGPEAENFVVDMKLIWPDGHVEDYAETIHVPAGSNSAFIDFGAWDGLLHPPIYIDDVLQNPSVNHRLKLESSTGSYDPTPQANAPAGVYHIEATFKNVTEIAFNDAYFTVADLGLGNVLLNADGGPAGAGATISVPADVLGPDGILHMNESFTYSFDVGLAVADASELTVDANGVPHDWVHPDPEPSYDANNASFVFAVNANNTVFLPVMFIK